MCSITPDLPEATIDAQPKTRIPYRGDHRVVARPGVMRRSEQQAVTPTHARSLPWFKIDGFPCRLARQQLRAALLHAETTQSAGIAFACRAVPEFMSAPATFRIRRLGGLGATPGLGEQPRRRQATAWLRLSEVSSPGGAVEAAALVLAIQEFVASGGGRRQVGAARVLHRRGGGSALAVSVGVAVGVPKEQRPRARSTCSRLVRLARSGSEPESRTGLSSEVDCVRRSVGRPSLRRWREQPVRA